MSNVVDFKRPPKPKEPKKLSPSLRKVLTVVAIVAALALTWTYFYLTGA